MTHDEMVARTLARYRVSRGGRPNGGEVVAAIKFALDEAQRECKKSIESAVGEELDG